MGSGSKKGAQIPFYRGQSTKNPKAGGLNDYAMQGKYSDPEDFFDDDEAEYMREPRQHNFYPSGAVKPAFQDYEFEANTEEDLMKLCKDHENLIDLILEEEEEVTNSHKEVIDSEVETVKDEMKLLYEVQKPNSDIKQYVETLHSMLEHKIKMMTELKHKVMQFGEHLMQEERLSEEFKRKQSYEIDDMEN